MMKPELHTNQLYIDDHIVMTACYPTPSPHSHLALHLILAAQGFLECTIEGAKVSAPAIMIAADVMHTVRVANGKTVVFLFDALSAQGQNIQRLYLQSQPYYALPTANAAQLQQLYLDSNGNLPDFDRKVCAYLHLQDATGRTMDARIQNVLHALTAMDTLPEDAFAFACRHAGLSGSRFSHLFKENTGMSFRRYLVLLKMQIAYNSYQSGKSITDIAMDAGFDSPSHFANTMHRMFGLSASDFLNSSK